MFCLSVCFDRLPLTHFSSVDSVAHSHIHIHLNKLKAQIICQLSSGFVLHFTVFTIILSQQFLI